jgi:anhydro-N-acetylmuramic acid kinase
VSGGSEDPSSGARGGDRAPVIRAEGARRRLPSPLLVAGLMSGTSLDGLDAALVELRGATPSELAVRVLAFRSVHHPEELRERIRAVVDGGTARELALLHTDLGRVFGRGLAELLTSAGVAPQEVAAVGSHGQTIWHEPPATTLQLGCPHALAEASGVGVVSDFRARDVAAGGQGAPLVPWADWVLFRRPGRGRALQNLGGMGNVTFLPPRGGVDVIRAFDTGPGVALLDGTARRASQGRDPWDVDGRRARSGTVDEDLLERLLYHPFFRTRPPRSTGRESFGERYLDDLVERVAPESEGEWNDLLATLTALTARSVAQSYREHLPWSEIHEVVLTGGGARNPALVEALTRALAPLPVRTGAEALAGEGEPVDPDAREAVAFALLAWAHLTGHPANVPGATGAAGPRLLGSWTPAPSRPGEGGGR